MGVNAVNDDDYNNSNNIIIIIIIIIVRMVACLMNLKIRLIFIIYIY